MFMSNKPNQENCGAYYDAMTAQGYDDWNIMINFTDPYRIVDCVS